MNTTIIQGDFRQVGSLADESADLLVFVFKPLTGYWRSVIERAAAPKLRDGGEVIMAESLTEAFEEALKR